MGLASRCQDCPTTPAIDSKLVRRGFGRLLRGAVEPQICQKFWVRLLNRQQIVAGSAILRHHVSSRVGVVAVMAPKATGRVVVANVVRIRSPCDFHRRKYVAVINCQKSMASLLDLPRLLPVDFRITALVVSN